MKKFALLCGLFLGLLLVAGCCCGDCVKKCSHDKDCGGHEATECCGTCDGDKTADCCGTCGGDEAKADAKKTGGGSKSK